MSVQSLDHLPAPVSVLGVLGQPPHEEVGLHRLRSEDVISLVLLQSPGLDAVTEPHGLRPELGVGPVVTLVTGVGDLLGQL